MTNEKIEGLLENAIYTFAKSMPNIPHEYTLKKNWNNPYHFEEAVRHIRKYGIKQKFWKKTYTYLFLRQYKYWTMNNPVDQTILINRERLNGYK